MKTRLPEAALAATRAVLLPEILDVPELARWLRCSESSARRLLREGRIPGRRIGKRWLVSREALLQVLVTGRDRSLVRLLGRQDSDEGRADV